MSISSYLDAFKESGMTVRLIDGSLRVAPMEKLRRELRAMLRDHRKEIVSELLEETLSVRGWLAIQSEVLGETVVFVRDVDVEIPDRYRQCVVYTRDEFKYVVGLPPEALREIHEAKREFGGTLDDPSDCPFDEDDLDPRPDLVEDAGQWRRLLKAAQSVGLYEVLHGFRCMGARLAEGRIVFDPTRTGFTDQADFDSTYGEWLSPHTDALNTPLAGIRDDDLPYFATSRAQEPPATLSVRFPDEAAGEFGSESLREKLRDHLVSLGLPYEIAPGTTVSNAETFAAAQTRSLWSKSDLVRQNAVDRLALLGIEISIQC